MNKVHFHQASRSAVLIINLGSPDAPTKRALRSYLKEFLSDRRVIDLPRWQWLPILYGVILNVRPKKSAALYQKIWGENGSPLIEITRKQVEGLRSELSAVGHNDIIVDYAMRYGKPSIASKLAMLKERGVDKLLIVPMYPQYCDATTATVIDAVADAFKRMRYMPEWRFVHHWHAHPKYIAALVQRYHDYINRNGEPEKLLLSFHGVPKRYLLEGDPYFCFCHKTARLFADAAGLKADKLQLVFQSRFGREEWLKPYADKTIEELAHQGVKKIAIMCPGFTADCLETLEEMAETNKELFLQAGGEQYDYIPALNADADHIEMLVDVVMAHCNGWEDFLVALDETKKDCQKNEQRAEAWGKKIGSIAP